METLPWSRSTTLTAERAQIVDHFVMELQTRFTAQFSASRKARSAAAYEFSLPHNAIPRDTLTVETVLQILLSFFYDSGVVPTVLPFAISQVPSLARMTAAQARITCMVVAAVATRPIVTLHELETEACLAEGVEAFGDLGFGRQIHCLPAVQQYFKLPPTQPHVPVTSADFLAFLCHDADTRQHILQAQGDARDAVNAFANQYADTARSRRTADCKNTGEESPLPLLNNNRQLGIHVQSLPALQLLLRQYTSHAMTCATAIVAQANTQLDRNALFYTRVIEALDASLAMPPSRTDDTGVVCDVRMTEDEVRDTTLPLRLWQDAPRGDARGGLCLKLSSCPAPAPQRAAATSPANSGSSSFFTVAFAPTATAIELPEKAPTLSAGTRRRGRVIVDTSQVSAPPPPPPPATSTTAFGLTPLGVAEPAVAASCTATTTDSADSADKVYTPGETRTPTTYSSKPPQAITHDGLLQCLGAVDDRAFAEDAIDALSTVCTRDVLSRDTLTRLFVRLARVSETHRAAAWLDDLLRWCRDTAFIPLMLEVTTTTTVTVRDVASPSEVYWCSSPSDLSVDEDVTRWLSRSLDGLFDTTLLTADDERCLRSFFTSRLRVPTTPTLRVWVAAVFAHKRHDDNKSTRHLTQRGTALVLRALDVCVRADFHTRLAGCAGDGTVALQQVLESVPAQEAVESAVFPLAGRWHRGRADLFFSGPTYMQYTDTCALQPVAVPVTATTATTRATSIPPALLVLPFPSEPHFAVQAVLEHFGARPLDAWVTKTIRLETMAFVETALDIHRRLQLVLPFVQAYLRTTAASLYAMIRAAVARRLQSFRVVLGRGATLRAVLPYFYGTDYRMQRTFPLLYVTQHNTLYGEDSACTPHVLADALTALFLPLTPEPKVVDGLRHVLRQLLSVVTSATGSLLSEDDLAMLRQRVHDEATEGLGITPLPHSLDESAGERHWTLSAAPFVRYQAHFPPGTDGTTSPAPFHRPALTLPPSGLCPATTASASHNQCRDAAGEGDNGVSAAASLVTFSPHCAERQWARSLPQWQSRLFGEQFDALQQLLREDRDGTQNGAQRVPRGRCYRTDDDDAQAGTQLRVDDDGMATAADAFLEFGSHAPFPGSKRNRDAGSGSSKLARHEPNSSSGGSRAGGGAVGYRGSDESAAAVASEAFVYRTLVEQYARDDPAVSVLWVNEHSERGTPYDLLVVRRRGPRETPNVLAFVEVKSTTQAHRGDFEMSLRELLFAARYGSAYQIHRVFKASATRPEQMRVQVLADLVSMWHRGQLSMTGEVRVMPATQGSETACSKQ